MTSCGTQFVSLCNLQNALRDSATVRIRVRLWLAFGSGLVSYSAKALLQI